MLLYRRTVPTVSLDTPVQYVGGVGPRRAEQFKALGIESVADLLEHLPFRYELRPKSQPIGHLVEGETATIVGRVNRVASRGGFSRPSIIADVVDATGQCRARWFNAPYVRDQLRVGDTIRLTGKVTSDERRGVFVNPSFRVIPDTDDPFGNDRDEWVPVYPATGALPSATIARIVRGALDSALDVVSDPVPQRLRAKRELPPRRTAIARCHQPVQEADATVARRRLAYDELLMLQAGMQMRRRRRSLATNAPAIVTTAKYDERIRARLPFKLTPGQERAVHEIAAELAATRPMARLLQGDVGAGKTAVAVYAALATVANRLQVAILSPTEVLARQTFDKLRGYLEGSQVRIELFVGGMAKSARDELLAKLRKGETDIVVGTHALIEKDVQFRAPGLVVVDEQHRFGVAQRRTVRAKGRSAHYLAMTATPIPRTLAMTLYGDLDITTIDGLPPGRQEITTRLVGAPEFDGAWLFVRERLSAGEQAYVVCPLVEESEQLDLAAAATEAQRLQDKELAGFKVGLLHGRMRSEEKAAAVDAFRSGDVRVLVSTTVIEVGVDVPDATVMVIEHAERYGLSQLHQLRGRIGRGAKASWCLLMSDVEAERSRERLAMLCSTQDGFRIAEADLLMRGPGEVIGMRQHGLPIFKAADLSRDLDLLRQARDDAAELLAIDPDLNMAEHIALREATLARFPDLAIATAE